MLDPLVKLNTDVVRIKDYSQVRFNDGLLIAKYYTRKFAFIADVLAALPWFP